MIAQLSGTVVHVGTSSCVIDVNGVGFLVQSTPGTLAQLRHGSHALLHTAMVVREDSLTLFGFADAAERRAFETLQNVQGVGPKLALALLSVHDPASLASAVEAGDAKALERVPGVGAKVAARLLLELGGKLVLPADGSVRPQGDARDHVVEALVNLGWNAKAATAAVEGVASEPISEADVPQVLRTALKTLGGSRG